jgi:hypothetical protein
MWSAELADEVAGRGDGDLMEMPRDGKHRKPKAGFPTFPSRLEIAFAIPTFPQVRRRFMYRMAAESEGSRSAERSLNAALDLARLRSAGL